MITKPTLLIDEIKCRANIQRMYSKSQKYNLEFRPHFKTHQSLEIGRWFKDTGTKKITVSSISMADYFSSEWNDITVAFPLNILEIKKINDLAERITLNLTIENEESILFLSRKSGFAINIFLKIDVGFHRTGISPNNSTLINKIIEIIDSSSNLTFKGFLGHAGQTYKCRGKEEIKQVHGQCLRLMQQLRTQYIKQYPDLIISLGDTPSCSVAEDFTCVDEIRPGNFVFYDLTQNIIGSNLISDIAVALACPVVAIHENRSEVVVYGGGVHFSKEYIQEKEGKIFGRVAEQLDKSWGNIIPGMYVKALSQEHGILSVPIDKIKKIKIGDILMILPVHSCMTGNLMKCYYTFEGLKILRLS
ncbi:alanine racemase [Bacteroidota bacterium]